MIGVESICTGSMSSPTLSALMIHEIDLTVKIWLGYGRDEEPTKKPSCSIRKQHVNPYLARQLSIEYHRQSFKGYNTKVD